MAKKVNTGFLIGLTAVVGGIAVGAFALFYLSHHTSKYYLDRSIEEERKGNIKLALGFMSPATGKDPANKALYIRQGDLAALLVSEDARFLGNSEAAYRRALEIDPAYPDAINRLLKNAIGRIRAGDSSPAFFKDLKDVADKGVAGDSANAHYVTWSAIAVLHPWVFSNAPSTPNVERAGKLLSDVARQHPEEYDAAFYASLFDLRRVQQLRALKQDDQAKPILEQIAPRHQAAVKARPQDSAVQLRAFQILHELAKVQPDRTAEFTDQSKAAIVAARANAKPDDELFDEICHWQIAGMIQDKAPREEIEKAYAAWSSARPHDAFVRLEHAHFLGSDPARRGDAIALLAAPVSPDPSVTGFAAIQAKGNERAILVDLNNLRADDALTAKADARVKLLASIDGDLTRIQEMGLGEDASLLKLRGKSQMLHNQPIEAVKSFERAQAMIGANTFEPDLWTQRQRAYLITGQTGSAQRMMEDLIVRMPGNDELRARLARLYLETGQPEKAAEQLKQFDAKPPTDPAIASSIKSMKEAAQAAQLGPAGAKEAIAALPEQTREQQMAKAQRALGAGENEEAVRLFRLVLHTDPADLQAGSGLVTLLLRDQKKEDAMRVVDDALKAKPDDSRWKNVKEQLSANTPEARRKVQEDLINQIDDRILRALRLADVALGFGDLDGAARHFAEAEKVDPKDPRVLLARITLLVRQKKLDEAAHAVDDAATANVDRMGGLSIRTQYALGQQDYEAALKFGNQLVSQYGEFAVNWVLYGRAQQAVGQLREAIGSMDAALQRQPNLPAALQVKAVCLEALGQYADEKDAIAQARRLAPGDQSLRDLELNWELHHGDPEKVVTSCQELLAKDPTNVAVYAAFAQASRATADLKYRADAATYKQLLEKARAVLDDGFKRFGQTPDVVRLLGPQAMVLDGLGDAAGAESALKQLAARPESANSPLPSDELAKFYETHNRLPEAEAAWKEAYSKSGQSVEAELSLAQFYARHGKADEALKVLNANPTDRRVQRQRIESLLAMGRIPEAKAALVAAFGSNPTDPAALYYRGILEFKSGDSLAGLNDLTSSRDKDPESVMTRIWLAQGLVATGRRDDAVVQLEYALQRSPLRDDVRLQLLDAYFSDPPRWADFDRVVLEAEQNPTLNINPQWYQVYSRGLARRSQFDAAKQQILAAQKLAPSSLTLQDEYVNVLVQAKDWPNVLTQTEKQIGGGRKEGMIYGSRGVAYAGLQNKPAALRDFDMAITAYQAAGNVNGIVDIVRTLDQVIGPDEALLRINLIPDSAGRDMLTANIYGDKQDYAREAQIAESVLVKYPKLPDATKAEVYSTVATAYLSTSQWNKAHLAYDNLLKYRPNDLLVLNNVAYLLADKLNAPLDAKSYSKRAYEFVLSHGGEPGIIDTHGWILTLCGGRDAPQGLNILEKLVDSNQNLTKSRYHLVQAYLRAGRTADAAEHLKILQAQIAELQKNNLPVDAELLSGVPKIAEQVRQKAGVP